LEYAGFKIRFAPDGVFTLQSQSPGWPALNGTWKTERNEVTLQTTGGPQPCATAAGRYRFALAGTHLKLSVVQDECVPRRLMLDGSTWRPEGEAAPVPERKIVRTGPDRAPVLPKPAPAKDSWPSFRGPNAVGIATGQNLAERWDVKTRENILWSTPTPFGADDVIVVASGRGPERPIFVVRPGARGDITLGKEQTSNAHVAWSKTGRGSYMPTPLAYDGILYVLGTAGSSTRTT
jgi:hypothetical protein